MAKYAETIERLMAELGKLPGIGSRTAERLAFHLLKASKEEALALARANEKISELIEGKALVREIFVPARPGKTPLVNLVVKG